MPFQFTISPDFPPDHISGWYIFNTWLQRNLEERIHLELFDSFESQRSAIASDQVDFIYANPYDAAMLVREKGFKSLVKPMHKADEASIVVRNDNPARTIEELQPGLRVVSTDDPDIHLIGMIMLEPADLDASNIDHTFRDSYVMVAKSLLNGSGDVGFFLAEAYDNLSGIVKKDLRVLVSSQIHLIHHALLVGPSMGDQHPELDQLLLGMGESPKGQHILEGLGLNGWEPMEEEEMEFMIDLMDTLGAS